MACWRCDDTGQAVTRQEPYEFTYQGRTITTKTYTYVTPCGVCERGARIQAARVLKGIMREARRESVA